MLQQAAKSLFTANVAKPNCIRWLRPFRFSLAFGSRLDERFVFQPLMWSLKMVMNFEFRTKDIHVLVTEHYKMVETLLLDRLDESFNEGNFVG